jgi:hypothetical protein
MGFFGFLVEAALNVLAGPEFCFVLVGHHSRSLWVLLVLINTTKAYLKYMYEE